MTKKSIPPSISATAFDCPHCGAYTTQYWLDVFGEYRNKNQTPRIPNDEIKKRFIAAPDISSEDMKIWLKWYDNMGTGLVFLEKNERGTYVYDGVNNLYLSKCYNCNKIAVWVHDNLLFPNEKLGIHPNPDLSENIIHDFEEARAILGLSPRGAVALLRLCVQNLCIHLGEKGKNIDDDIASLVSKGLNPVVQKSLDIVRVIGNEAVHPGVLDIKYDRDTASQLLVLINSIADQMISHPKQVEELYKKLPAEKRKAIEKRNDKAKS
jgi:hypothetical protein